MDRLSFLTAIEAQGVVPVFHHADPEVGAGVIAACAAAGAPCVEFTNRGEFAADAFLRLSKRLAGDPRIALGVGSIVDAPTAALFLANGARFVVGPVLNAEVARLCNRRMIAYIPGCGTASEISQAHELGCEIVKLFPGDAAGGPAFVRSVLGPMPWAKIMPTGGVGADADSLEPWFAAGVTAVGIGSDLIPPSLLEARDYAAIEARVRTTVEAIRRLRVAT